MRHREVNAQFDGRRDPAPPDRERRHRRRGAAGARRPGDPLAPSALGSPRSPPPAPTSSSRAREGKLQRADLEGGTFTISNLGMFGVEQFIAVLNPPQAAILAVGATEERAVAREGEVVVRPMMTLTLTFDHRAVDGAPAADFLQTVKELLEEPGLML